MLQHMGPGLCHCILESTLCGSRIRHQFLCRPCVLLRFLGLDVNSNATAGIGREILTVVLGTQSFWDGRLLRFTFYVSQIPVPVSRRLLAGNIWPLLIQPCHPGLHPTPELQPIGLGVAALR